MCHSRNIKYPFQRAILPLVIKWEWNPGGSDGKETACNAGDLGLIPGSGRSPGRGHGNPLQYSCLEKSPWTEEPGRLKSMGSQRVRHSWVTKHSTGVEQRATPKESCFTLRLQSLSAYSWWPISCGDKAGFPLHMPPPCLTDATSQSVPTVTSLEGHIFNMERMRWEDRPGLHDIATPNLAP